MEVPSMGGRPAAPTPPLVVHVIHELGVGGLENGLVNLINRMSERRFRHAIVCMTHSSQFSHRIRRADVQVYPMYRGQVPLWRSYLDLTRLFIRLGPTIVHSRNLSGLDALVPAFLAGVPVRIHGEHGRDMDDLDGSNRKHRRLKRLFRPLVTHYTTVSRDLADDLVNLIGAKQKRITQIYNGVDTELFAPARTGNVHAGLDAGRGFVIGTVGRLQPVKDQASLVRAFAEASRRSPAALERAQLVVAGEGPSRRELEQLIADTGLGGRVMLLGSRDDVPEVLRSLDLFVLPSLAEGISNTILEAMASGLPVVATRVGGNADLVEDGKTGSLVNAGDWQAMAGCIVEYATDVARRHEHGRTARLRAEQQFSLASMVNAYADLYDRLIAQTH